jgi:hypothetical protein
MSDGDRRVSMKPLTVAGGMTATPEGIADLERRRAEIERTNRPPPTQPFSAHMKKKRAEQKAVDPVVSEKEKKRQALPKKGPRPGMVHPAQRDVYGRDDEENEEAIVLKG